MGRILAIDYGKKRTGIAVTDPLQIIASPLDTISTNNLLPFLKKYIHEEQVEKVVIGMPKRLDNTDTHATPHVVKLIDKLKSTFPQLQIFEEDERFTSKLAIQSMIESGMKKKDRREKGNIDKISATLILQSFLDNKI